MRVKQKGKIILLTMAIVFMPVNVYAQYSSPNYMTEETFFGTGGELDASSTNYRSRQSAGSLGVGQTSSNNFDATGGFITPETPFLEFYVTGATVNLGNLSDSTTSFGEAKAGTCDCSFTVRTYLSSEYVVLTLSQPPTSENGSILDAKTVLGAPITSSGVEEFGINLVDNTTPNIGANPVNVPDDTFADGSAETGYSTVDQFKYGVGDVIARSAATAGNQAAGTTNYTISYIAKRSSITEAGFYRMSHDLVVVATY